MRHLNLRTDDGMSGRSADGSEVAVGKERVGTVLESGKRSSRKDKLVMEVDSCTRR